MREYINEHGEHMVQVTLEELGPITDEEREMARQAAIMPQPYDPDCPPMSEEIHNRIMNKIAARQKTQSVTVKIINRLWETGRGDDARRAEDDREFLDKLIGEYHQAQMV